MSPSLDERVCHGCAERCISRSCSKLTMCPAMALAATVEGLASQTSPGPERPGKLRLMALTVT